MLTSTSILINFDTVTGNRIRILSVPKLLITYYLRKQSTGMVNSYVKATRGTCLHAKLCNVYLSTFYLIKDSIYNANNLCKIYNV